MLGVRLGKLPARHDKRNLQLNNYTSGLAASPLLWDVPALVKKFNFGMMGNDKLGDCTAAAIFHQIQVWTYYARNQVVTVPDSEVIRFYSLTTGYNPSDPNSDRGGVELDILNYWRKNSFDNHTLSSFISITPPDHNEFRDSIYYFGGAYLGIQLPIAAQGKNQWVTSSLSCGPSWEPGSWGGHAVVSPWYNKIGPVVITWGTLLQMSWDFLDRYCDEAYCLLSPDYMNNNNRSPLGFDFETLSKDLQLVTAA